MFFLCIAIYAGPPTDLIPSEDGHRSSVRTCRCWYCILLSSPQSHSLRRSIQDLHFSSSLEVPCSPPCCQPSQTDRPVERGRCLAPRGLSDGKSVLSELPPHRLVAGRPPGWDLGLDQPGSATWGLSSRFSCRSVGVFIENVSTHTSIGRLRCCCPCCISRRCRGGHRNVSIPDGVFAPLRHYCEGSPVWQAGSTNSSGGLNIVLPDFTVKTYFPPTLV